jgi:hypothetical protein
MGLVEIELIKNVFYVEAKMKIKTRGNRCQVASKCKVEVMR